MERELKDQERDVVSATGTVPSSYLPIVTLEDENKYPPGLPIFILDYVSGQITASAKSEVDIKVFGYNGSGYVHVYVTQHFPDSVFQIYDSGDVFVNPNRNWGSRIQLPNLEDEETMQISVAISVASEFLIPTVDVRLSTASESLDQSFSTNFIHYKPSDFALFKLQYVVPAGTILRQRLW